MIDQESGLWYPDLFDRQLPVFNSRARALLVSGPRKSGKTWVVLHKLIRHMWETKGARLAMFSRTLKNSKEAGTWADLHQIILPEWIGANIGLRYTTYNAEGQPGFKVDGQTRTPRFKIRNAWGGESECMLFSLDFDGDVEDKLKEQRFSMIYFSELSKFRDRKILSVALPQLRMPHLKMDEQMWIADTNPSEEGESSWIYEVWYVERNLSYEKYADRKKERGLPVMSEESFLNFQRGLQLVEIRPEENPFLDPRELEELKSTYSYDEGLYARYVLGKWVYGDGDHSRHFRTAFLAKHVIGNCEDTDENNWILAVPSPNSFQLISGWDLGDRNHAAVLLDKVWLNGKSVFIVLDELESIGDEVSNEDFTVAFMQLVTNLEEQTGRQFDLERAWSDRSSIERYSATGDTFPYLQVYAASEERIFLRGVPKAKGSVRARVALIKQLLKQDRLFVSAHCKATKRMFKELKKGSTEVNYVVQDENKHIFDALSYPIFMECAEDLENMPDAGKSTQQRRPLIVQIG
jgi:phage terminase large subunit